MPSPTSTRSVLTQCQDIAPSIRALNNLLTTKLHGDHLLFPNEQALNESIRSLVIYVKTHQDMYSVSTPFQVRFVLPFTIHLWLLEIMVSEWSDERALDGHESVGLVRLRDELEDTPAWRKAVSRVWGEDAVEEGTDWSKS